MRITHPPHTIMATISALLMAAPCLSAPQELEQGEKFTLRPALQANARYEMQQTVSTTMQGGKQYHTATQDYTLAVVPHGPGDEKKEKLVRSMVDHVRIETNATADQTVIAYDSGDRREQHPDLAEMAKGMLAVTSGAIYAEDDRFKAFEGTVEDAPTQEMMRKLTDLGFPEEPVGPGDTWKHQIETEMGQMGTVKYDLEFKFAKVVSYDGSRCALLAISGSLSTLPGAGANEGFDIKSRSLRGVLYFDPELGAVRKYEINSLLDLTAYGKKMPGSMTIRTVLKRFSK